MKRGAFVITQELLKECLELRNNIHIIEVKHHPYTNRFEVYFVDIGQKDPKVYDHVEGACTEFYNMDELKL